MQSKILKVLTVGAVSMCAVCSAACVAYAEGSKDLVENGGYRPYLEWNSKTNLEMTRENVIYVYAKKDETICFGSSENAQDENSIKAIGGKGDIDSTWYGGTNAVGIAVTLPKENSETEAVDANGLEYVLYDNNISDRSKVYLFKVDKSENGTGVGYIKDVDQETDGPNVNGDMSSGYTPLSFTAPYTGTYSFRFLSSRHDNSSDPTPVESTDQWTSNGGTVAAFDVTVYKDNEPQTGRVWADRLFLNSGSWKENDGIYSKYYVLTDDAFAYEVDLNGMSSWGFVLYSNKRGFLWDPEDVYTNDNTQISNLQSLNRSFYSAATNDTDVGAPPVFNNGTIYPNYKPETDQDVTHKLFFNDPSISSEVLEFYTGKTALAGSEENKISGYTGQVTKSFTDGRDSDNNNVGTKGTEENPFKSTIGYGGTFTVQLSGDSIPETLSLMLDFSDYKLEYAAEHNGLTEANNVPVLDENGAWAKLGKNETSPESEQNVVTLTATNDGSGVFKFTWSGLDAYGNVVPAGTYTNSVSLYAAYGVAHFPMIDIENSPNGVQIKMLNNITFNEFEQGKDEYTVYYNNSKFSELFDPNTAFSSKNLGDNKNAANGISSQIIDGKSAALQFTNQDGNQTALDIWADLYDEIESDLTIEITEHPVLYPILSYVAEGSTQGVPATNAETGYDGTLDKNTKSHVWYNSSAESEPRDTGAVGGIYGNTISTGFSAYLQNVSAYSVRNNILWTVTIPNPSENTTGTGMLYVKDYDKAADGVADNDIKLSAAFTDSTDDNTVITDTDGTTILNGSIKQINSFRDSKSEAVMELYDNQGTVITGRGTVLYGLVIDRIYAPDATATVEYVHEWDRSAGWTDITDTDSTTNPVHSQNAGEYATSDDNIYYSLFKAQSAVLGE